MTSHIEFLVEEPSAEAALKEIVPKIVGNQITFQIHVHEGKRQLLASLENRLRGYSRWLPEDWRIVVLIDEDRQDCEALKGQMESIAGTVGLKTKSTSPASFRVLNRVAVEELEAWFLGDVEALCAAFPGVPASLATKSKFRDPDMVLGGTWEALERVLQKAGHFRGGLAKIEVARTISKYMVLERNRSRSFQVFIAGLKETAEQHQ
jgi:hypothetical protein